MTILRVTEKMAAPAKTMQNLLATSIAVALTLSGVAPLKASAVSPKANSASANQSVPGHLAVHYINPVAAPDELIIVPEKNVEKEDMDKSLKTIGATMAEKDLMGEMFLVKVDKTKIDQVYQKALKDKNFKIVQRNMTYKAQFTASPNDPGFQAGLQPCLQVLDVPNAWALGAAGQGLTVGSLDTGVDYLYNPDLQGRSVGWGYNTVAKVPFGFEQNGAFGHGTFTMTCLGATTNNNFGFAAPAFGCAIQPVCISAPGLNGEFSSNDFLIGMGLEVCIVTGVKVVNLSFNADPPFSLSDPDHPLMDMLLFQYSALGGLVFNSAGNSGIADNLAISKPGLVPVASLDPNQNPSVFTVSGPQIYFAAPGEDIVNTAFMGNAFIASGTSFSSPMTAAVALQVLSVKPYLPLQTVLQIMINTAQKPSTYSQQFMGYGIPDAAAAVRLAQTSF